MKRRKLERAYQAFVTCRDVIRTSTSEEELLRTVCHMTVSTLGYRLAWIGLLTEDGRLVRPVAQAGYEEGYLDNLRITAADDEFGQGPTGRAIRERRPAVCRDIATDDRFLPWRDDALRRGYASSVALPFSDGIRCLGALNLYAAEADAFDDDEMALLEEMVVDLQLGIQRHRMQSKLESMQLHVEQALQTEAAAAANMALGHDIANLLQVISTSLELTRVATNSEVREGALKTAQDAAVSIRSLVRRVLSLGRRSSSSETVTDVDQSIRGSMPLLARLAPRGRIEFRLGGMGVRARIASIDLERILINLVVNAHHAMPSGGGLQICTEVRELREEMPNPAGTLPPGKYLCLSVVDEGEGIEPEVLPRIFDPFFTTKAKTGTGLGLPGVLALLQKAEGGVEIDTHIGEGTRVSVLLPVAPPDG